ncbi:hypothetical protein FSP39_016962 [Pinctada imbricata]|uniref:HTH OST-type domain-containing protein n=1 Tax=Pinctada imbricata TaxID=66713 RepID=A0AA89BQ08_PINIB|nr:hypothetical protein FSP39_016962 [Pinctada imbricata]
MSNQLPPIGVFWDIENCSVPKWKSALSVVQLIREKFFADHREVEFMCVCDTTKESKDVIQELNNAQVNVVHINATSKNAADDKLRQSLRRFADNNTPPASLVLISSDVNFASDLSDLRHRKKFTVILVHSRHVAEALKICATHHYVYEDLVGDLPQRTAEGNSDDGTELEVFDYPIHIPPKKIHRRLKTISVNCGGRVISVTERVAVVRFACHNDAAKAKKRMEGEDVYGGKIKVKFPDTDDKEERKDSDHFGKPQQDKPFSQFDSKHSKEDSKNVGKSNGNKGKNKGKKNAENQGSNDDSINNNNNKTSTQSQNQETASPNNLQNVVNKFAKDKKGSRQVLMLQQQLYQEGQEKPSLSDSEMNRYNSYQQSTTYQYNQSGGGGYQHYQSYYNQQRYNVPNSGQATSSFYHYGSAHNQSFSTYSAYKSLYEGNGSNYRNKKYMNNGYGNANNHITYHNHNQQQQQGGGCVPFNPGPYNVPPPGYCSEGEGTQPAFSKNTFCPITSPSPCPSTSSSSSCEQMDSADWDSISGPVELLVSNLDYNISAKEWRKILFTTFHPHVRVLNVHVKTQPDNTSLGMVKIPSVEEARFAISQFHRKKIGYKRIHVTLKTEDSQRPASSTKAEAMALLSEAKGNVLPLFKFIELFDKRYHRSISVSELYKMRDTIDIREQGGAGRMVYLANSPQSTSPNLEGQDAEGSEILEQPACHRHCPEGSPAYAEAVNSCMLPNVKVRLKTFATQVHILLQSHEGNMPLMSFPACYSHECGPLPISMEGGVPLEHLISCVPGIQIQVSPSGVKKIQWAENRPPAPTDSSRLCTSPLLSQQLNQFSREMIDLLKQQPQGRMPFSKFIPTYHHFFGRQCRVADYGYNRLKDLFEAVPHVVQVLGTGDRKILTLSNRAQIRRFTTDLLKILKSQPGKEMPVQVIPAAFASMFNKRWDVTEYGMAYLDDLLSEVPSSSIAKNHEGSTSFIQITYAHIYFLDQSQEEVERTKQFALEVVDLLKHNPQCRMPFNKFIPAYHHHFGRQCRVSEYGFTKLVDLFEAIPHVVEIEEESEERLIHLTEPELRKVLAEQLVTLLNVQKNQCIPLHHLMSAFTCHFGFNIPLYDFNVDSEEELLTKLKHVVKVEKVNRCKYVKLEDRSETPQLAHQVLQLLMDHSGGSLPLMELCSRYKSIYGVDCDIKTIKDELLDFVQVTGDDESAVISLTALQAFARDVRILLYIHSKLLISDFERVYKEHFGVEIKPALYGCPTITALLESIPHVVTFSGKGLHRVVQLSANVTGLPCSRKPSYSPSAMDSDTQSSDSGVTDTHPEVEDIMKHEVMTAKSSSLLEGPVPSAIPSPDLRPVVQSETDLMKFETVADLVEKLMTLSEEEKKGQKTPLCRTPTSELLQLAAQCLLSRPPSTEPEVKDTPESKGQTGEKGSSSKEIKEEPQVKVSDEKGWWKVGQDQVKDEETLADKAKKESFEKTEQEKILREAIFTHLKKEVESRRDSKVKESTPSSEGFVGKLVEMKIPTAPTGKFLNRSADSVSYDNMFRQDLPLETSSVKSDSSTLSDRSQESPRKSPRKPRIAAKFPVRIDMGN